MRAKNDDVVVATVVTLLICCDRRVVGDEENRNIMITSAFARLLARTTATGGDVSVYDGEEWKVSRGAGL